eukprot:3955659-Prorocentrum_lima.AAC.1
MSSITQARVTEAILAKHGVVAEEAPPLETTSKKPSPPQPLQYKEGLLALGARKGKEADCPVRPAMIMGDELPDIPEDEAAFQAALREHE